MTGGVVLKKVVIVSACRTPIGKIPGSMSNIKDTYLMQLAFREAINRIGLNKSNIDGVYTGCCFPQEKYNLARKALLQSGMPDIIPGVTINRTCCSSIEALVQGARQIMVGDAEIIMVGGVESMSNSPDTLKNIITRIRASIKGKLPTYDQIGENLIDEMGLTAEILARKYEIGQEDQDEYSYQSHQKATAAQKKGYFAEEIFTVMVDKGDEKISFNEDECINPGLTMEKMSMEPPIFIKDGTITRYNSSPVSDGAAAVILMSEERAKEEGLIPLAEFIASEVVGVSPNEMGIGSAVVIKKLLDKVGLSINDIDLFECNEAYAAQLLACQKLLRWDSQKVNIHGGSIALGHPVGCTGLRLCVTLVYAMNRTKSNLGLAALCAGGGMGEGVLFHKI